MGNHKDVGVQQQRLYNAVDSLEQILEYFHKLAVDAIVARNQTYQIRFTMRISVFQFVLIAPSELGWEPLLDLLIRQAFANSCVYLVEVFQGCAWSGDILNGAYRAAEFRCPNLKAFVFELFSTRLSR